MSTPLDIAPLEYDYCPDCKAEHQCAYCHDLGILVGARWGSDNMDVTFKVSACVDCTAALDRAVPPEVFGTYFDQIPACVLAYLGEQS